MFFYSNFNSGQKLSFYPFSGTIRTLNAENFEKVLTVNLSVMHYKTSTGFSLSDNDITEILRDWGINIQVGEQYSPVTIAHFIITILKNAKANCHQEAQLALIERCNEKQKNVLILMAKQISMS